MNIRFQYCYRDGANYKQFGEVVFANESAHSPEELTSQLRQYLIDDCWFDASRWNLPLLYRYPFDPAIDHGWHEFEDLELTTDLPTMPLDFEEWLAGLAAT